MDKAIRSDRAFQKVMLSIVNGPHRGRRPASVYPTPTEAPTIEQALDVLIAAFQTLPRVLAANLAMAVIYAPKDPNVRERVLAALRLAGSGTNR